MFSMIMMMIMMMMMRMMIMMMMMIKQHKYLLLSHLQVISEVFLYVRCPQLRFGTSKVGLS